MLNIELTLLIQAINFFVTYKILDYLLVRPATTFILQDKKTVETLEKKIFDEKETLHRYEEEKKEKWHECKAYFKSTSPVGIPETVVSLVESASIEPAEISQTSLRKMKTEISDALIEMVRL